MKFLIFLVCFFSINAFALIPPNLPLRGAGEYKWFLLSIYEARLWAERGDDIYSRPLVLQLKYSRDFKGKDIAEQSAKELLSTGVPKGQVTEWKQGLLAIFPDVKEGDIILASYHPENGILFHLNSQKELGRISDLNFSQKFLDIWLGEKTTAPDLRKKLLGINK